ncbi:CIA30 family protein [Tenacibaculum ovolyticum]|uniref:CIA30 family protein n=1 Tax=Tenacibaculum ovolyticum TaxID=104270 RepID=UPI001F388B98|nr:CIA30 family protein [Tenacibaculum ovolyticum]
MKWFILFSVFLCMNDEIIIFDKNSSNQSWYITNDDVMGGVSNSSMKLDEEKKMIFSGNVSLDNNGGFAMTRLPLNINFNTDKTKVVLKLKGDGKKYQFRIKAKNNQRFWYIQSFQTSKSTEEIELPLHKFYASFRGYKLNVDNFSETTITEIAILIGNKKNEKFKLEIERITLK